MVGNALVVTAVLFLALGFFVMQECQFLIPYRRLMVHRYGLDILTFAGALFVNVFAAVYWAERKLFLKDTGRKLAHLEKQLRTGSGFSQELADRLED